MSHDTVDKPERWSGATRIMSPLTTGIGIGIGGEERRWKDGLFLFLDSSKTRSRL